MNEVRKNRLVQGIEVYLDREYLEKLGYIRSYGGNPRGLGKLYRRLVQYRNALGVAPEPLRESQVQKVA